jgi:hypothetical protein
VAIPSGRAPITFAGPAPSVCTTFSSPQRFQAIAVSCIERDFLRSRFRRWCNRVQRRPRLIHHGLTGSNVTSCSDAYLRTIGRTAGVIAMNALNRNAADCHRVRPVSACGPSRCWQSMTGTACLAAIGPGRKLGDHESPGNCNGLPHDSQVGQWQCRIKAMPVRAAVSSGRQFGTVDLTYQAGQRVAWKVDRYRASASAACGCSTQACMASTLPTRRGSHQT